MHPTTEPATRYSDDKARWQAVLTRDAGAEGEFFFAVRTTGVFCRPTCPARKPRRENVRFFASAEAATRAGFRACKRCRPLGAAPEADQAARIARVCRTIEAAEAPLPLDALAAEAGLSPHHFHRLFKRLTGLTPKDYCLAAQAARMRESLPLAASVTEAIYAAGFSSSSRFYERAADILGMSVRTYRAGGKGIAMRYAIEACWLGHALIAGTERGICAIFLADAPETLLPELRRRFPAAEIITGDAAFAARAAEAVTSIENPASAPALPLDILGTAFQRRVWLALRQIPAGRTASYSGIAERIGEPKAARAVAGACAANHIAVAVPCHRVIRADGGMGGYRWGLARKRRLLEREAGDVLKADSVPK